MSVISLKSYREAPKSVRSNAETALLTAADMSAWELPGFQRPLTVNDKLRAIAEEMKTNGGFISGIITLGRVDGDKTKRLFIVDGQHRRHAFLLSELEQCIADVRIVTFESMIDMAKEYVDLNTAIVRMRPDDLLRGCETSVPALRRITEACEFVGYGQVRRGPSSPTLSMSIAVRCWTASGNDTPAASGKATLLCATDLAPDGTESMIQYLLTARAAWGSDASNARLWGALNLTVTMWMFRTLVVDHDRRGNKRYVVLSIQEFKRCLMSVSASSDYLDWLVGRSLSERDRGPCFSRLKHIFTSRIREESKDPVKKVLLPQPTWATNA